MSSSLLSLKFYTHQTACGPVQFSFHFYISLERGFLLISVNRFPFVGEDIFKFKNNSFTETACTFWSFVTLGKMVECLPEDVVVACKCRRRRRVCCRNKYVNVQTNAHLRGNSFKLK